MAIWETIARFGWFDAVVVGLIALYVWQDFEKEIYVVGSEFVSWIGAWLLGIYLAEPLAIFLVKNFGLWPQSSWLWSFIMLIVMFQQIIFRGLIMIFVSFKRIYFPKFWQLVLGLVLATGSGILVIFFLVIIAIKVPTHYPLEDEIENSWFGNFVGAQVTSWHTWLVGKAMDVGLQ